MKKPEKYKTIKTLVKTTLVKTFLSQAESTHENCIIKATDTSSMPQDKQNKLYEEAKKLGKLSHPCIIKVREVYRLKKSNICIVTDYLNGIFCAIN